MTNERLLNHAPTQDHAEADVDVVVVGSGFGGSVAAYRLAEGGRSVVVLERGRPYPPGGFARSPAAMARNFWDPSEGLYGLFDVWSFRGLEGVVSSGLGGGSLIYANVLLRKDEKWFVQESPLPGGGYEHWPISRADLDPHYDRVERMLGATPYPYRDTAKTRAMEEAADRLGLRAERPPIAVTFAPRPGGEPVPGAPVPEPEYGNVHGLPRSTCRLCGECDVGCNFGAKNTLDHTYLSAARHHGADLRTRCEVRGFAPRPGGGWEVRYVVHDPAREGHPTATDRLPLRRIGCRRLILAAGTFGSTYLLLRNRGGLPGISPALGTRFSGNGDLLGLVLEATDGAAGRGPRRLDSSTGPVITTAVRVGDELDGDGSTGRGFYVEDAGYPAFVDWLAEEAQIPGDLRRTVAFGVDRLRARFARTRQSHLSRQLSLLLGSGVFSESALPLLGMGRDVPDGRMSLAGGFLEVDWTVETSLRYFERVRSTMRALAEELGGEFVDNPLWWAHRVITVHPLGGAPMGRHPTEGVCDSHGEVFGLPGLYVLDGSALPGPVGANPSLTIAAFADRACDHILTDTSAPRVEVAAPVPATTPGPAAAVRTAGPATPSTDGERATSLSFTEEMKGYVALDAADPEEGRALGRSRHQRLMFRLTITAPDVDRFVADPGHPATAVGHVECDLLGGLLPVEHGWFNLFTRDGDPGRRLMLYRLHLRDPGGNPVTLVGHKDVHDDPGFDLWRDTSTLYFRLLSGHVLPDGDEAAPLLGAGVVNILVRDFVHQLTTFRTTGPHPAQAMEHFGRLFLGQLWAVYGPHLGRADQPV
ncbi:GMC family oxidoreductase [Streptomyces kaniharaensis]|uniref:Cholesterol oxidase n=1 Tax=Streptomyces kaniharaensis TaxID=212423 RepID=A0A6N7KZF6_9ACTN|nr:GMC oxidoreductase [Streptomyces kaniharaensis]MQS17032.1 GMC family oxidoreductase [Streptomyces kaniharaensis]